MKIILFGSNGMLGEYVNRILSNYYQIMPLTRDDFDLININKLNNFLQQLNILKNDILINCTVIRRDRINIKGMKEAILINSVVPHFLADFTSNTGAEFIHISSDCVFSGKNGNYTENDTHDPLDIDGRTKSLGEPETATIIRTSIIGEEIREKRSLLEWVKSQKGTINGYSDYFWNGITCLQLAKIINKIIENRMYWKGVRHIFSPTIVSKYELVNAINEVYEVGLNINKYNAGFCNRSLSSIYINDFNIPQIHDQIVELKNFKLL
jgi:dTDP-4-dehydrorhamnose reductase